jgi:hypothetical protein
MSPAALLNLGTSRPRPPAISAAPVNRKADREQRQEEQQGEEKHERILCAMLTPTTSP